MVRAPANPIALKLALVIGLLTGFVGCGGDPGAYEELVPVEGTVNFEGEPADGAIVTFTPYGKNTKAHVGVAVADSDGKFEMLNFRKKKGLPQGDYIVTISWKRGPDGEPLDPDKPGLHGNEMIPPPWNLITKAGKHNKLAVPEDGKTDFEFNISKNMTDESTDRAGRITVPKNPGPGGGPRPPGSR